MLQISLHELSKVAIFWLFFFADFETVGGHFEGKLGILFSKFNDFLLCSVLICYKSFFNPFLTVN